MPHLSLLPTIIRELLPGTHVERVPEEAVMTGDISAYAEAGLKDSVMAAAYLYHTARICQVMQGCSTVVDMGCGPASQLSTIAELNPHIQFIGFDLSDDMVAQGQALAKKKGLTNLDVRKGDVTAVPGIEDHSIDGVMSTMTLHQFEDTAFLGRCFDEMARILKPGGSAYIVDFGRLKSHKSMRAFVDVDRANQPAVFNDDYENSLKAAFLKEELAQLARDHLPPHLKVYSTFGVPMLVVIKSEDRPIPDELRAKLREMRAKFPKRYQSELDDIRFFFKLGGLKNDPF